MLWRMVRIVHDLVVEPLARTRAHELLLQAYEVASSTRAEADVIRFEDGRPVPGLRLVKGRHLTPGAVYDIDDEEPEAPTSIVVRQWHRQGIQLDAQRQDAQTHMTLEGRLGRVEHPDELDLRGTVNLPWPAYFKHVEGRARLGLRAWWDATEGRARASGPLVMTVEHRMARATLRATPKARGDGRWAIRVTVKIRGRSWWRPIGAVALRLGRGKVTGAVIAALDQSAAAWNTVVPQVREHGTGGPSRPNGR
jgi:hypothetical protein